MLEENIKHYIFNVHIQNHVHKILNNINNIERIHVEYTSNQITKCFALKWTHFKNKNVKSVCWKWSSFCFKLSNALRYVLFIAKSFFSRGINFIGVRLTHTPQVASAYQFLWYLPNVFVYDSLVILVVTMFGRLSTLSSSPLSSVRTRNSVGR